MYVNMSEGFYILQPCSTLHRAFVFFFIQLHTDSCNIQSCVWKASPIFQIWSFGPLVRVIPAKVCMPMRKWNQRSNLGCETARGLGGDTVTRWCYSNLFGRQSYAETEGLMSQSSWSEFGCRQYVLPSSICMPLKSWMGTAQETSKKIIQGPGTKMAFCAYRKV